MLVRCTHLAEPIGSQTSRAGTELQYRCRHPKHDQTTLCACLRCAEWLMPLNAEKPEKTASGHAVHPETAVVNRHERPAGVEDLYRGAAGFLVLGGPSTKTLPLHLLNQRGILILSVNNCPAVLPPPLRPHVWLHTDPCRKFHDSIWRDPGILKFTPMREWNVGRKNKRALRHRTPDRTLTPYDGIGARDMPGVLGFARNSEFVLEKWLQEPSFNRGNDEQHAVGTKGSQPNGWPHVINTMFTAIRLAFYLGVNPLYLIGADFKMDPELPYAFAQAKSVGGVRANNHAFSKIDRMLSALKPHFDAAGFEVFNCTPGSALWAFPRKDFSEAVAEATAGFQQELDCNGWYDSAE